MGVYKIGHDRNLEAKAGTTLEVINSGVIRHTPREETQRHVAPASLDTAGRADSPGENLGITESQPGLGYALEIVDGDVLSSD